MIFQFKDIQQNVQSFPGFDLLSATWRAETSVSFLHTLVFGPGSAAYELMGVSNDDQSMVRDLQFSDSTVLTVRSQDTEQVSFTS
ncbi:MAG: hypothetical protein AAF386_08540, partial [Pseudomonadota bacterium]